MALAMLEQLTSGMLTRVHLRTLIGHVATIPKEGPKDRKGLQELGTLINKSLEGVWIRAGLMKAGGFPKVVFTDVRRGSEFKALRDSGYYLVGIKAPERVRYERLAERDGITWEEFETMERHLAESEIDVLIAQCDSIIHNVENTRGFTALEQLETIIQQGGNGKKQ
nr:hypothetical protein [uncultured Anaeromusa sp.]